MLANVKGSNMAKRVSWQRIDSLRDSLSKEDFTMLAKYRARRDFATGFTHAAIPGMAKSTSEANFVMLKLGLAFTAAELLARVTSQKNNLGIKSPKVAKALNQGKLDKLLKGIEADHLRRYPKSDPNLFVRWENSTETTDLTALVSQMRNYVFHGSFSPSESGLATSSSVRDLVLELANSTIEASEIALDKWIQKHRLSAENSQKYKSTR